MSIYLGNQYFEKKIIKKKNLLRTYRIGDRRPRNVYYFNKNAAAL